MLTTGRLHEMHAKLARPDMGTTSSADLVFIRDCITEQRPKVVIEVGVASGVSSGFIGVFMSENGGKTLHCIDLNDRFYADPSKPTGYLFNQICEEGKIDHKLHLNKTSVDVRGILRGRKADLVFIDANHQHPWPTLDTFAVLPHIRPGGLIIHHDVLFYRNDPDGIGPKYLFDEYREHGCVIADGPYQSIGYLVAPQGHYRDCESSLIRALRAPWKKTHIRKDLVRGLQKMLRDFWSDEALQAFNEGLESSGSDVI